MNNTEGQLDGKSFIITEDNSYFTIKCAPFSEGGLKIPKWIIASFLSRVEATIEEVQSLFKRWRQQ